MRRHLIAALIGILSLSRIVSGQEAADEPSAATSARGSYTPAGWSTGISIDQYTESLTKLSERFAQLEAEFAKGLPPRDVKVEVMPSEKMPLRRADPKLLENKYVARVTFFPAGIDPTDVASMRILSNRYQAFQQVSSLTNGSDWSPPQMFFQWPGGRPGRREPTYTHFQEAVKRCPENARPRAEIVEFLSSADSSHDVTMVMDNSTGMLRVTVDILAPTAEEAEARARAVVQLVDCGISRPSQEESLAHGRKRLELAQAALAEMTKIDEAIEAENKLLAVPSEISAEILSQLKSQKVMIAVEEAGLAARVKACDAMLADGKKLELSTLQSVSDMKVKAEIERVGLKEKLDQINKFIGEGDDRRRRQGIIRQLSETRSGLRRDFQNATHYATQFAELFELYAPFQVRDNKITVGPIEWVAADDK